ncbi:hypothetical protein K8R03_00070 [Candidatus Kaiserbacteria bacterium]|nr:hypothetical protein [Candidatus Kaiserbacteria bacterium]
MNDFTMMHVFFAVTTLAVLVFSLLACIAAWYVIRILKTVDSFSKAALEEAQQLRADIGQMRATVRAEGFKFKTLARFIKKQAARFSGEETTTQ